MTCHCCGTIINEGHPSFLGMLSVRCNSLGSRLVESRGQIIVLRNKCGGKMIGKKTPENIRSQRERDLAQLALLEADLPRMEGEFAGMRFRIRELERERHEERVKRGQGH